MSEKQRGVVVDAQGHFLAAIQWDAEDGAPRINPKGTPKGERNKLLTAPEAIDDPIPSGKWDAKAKVWLRPTEKHWLVMQRRDKPRYWTLSGERKVWPERLPQLKDGEKFVAVDPGPWRSRKPVWDDEAGEWTLPKSRVPISEDGACGSPVLVLEEADAGSHSVGIDDEGVPEGIGEGWTFDGEAFHPPSAPAITPAQVHDERTRRLEAGATITVTGYGDIPVQGRDQDQITILALEASAKDMAAAGVAAPLIPFRDRDNQGHMLTPDQTIELMSKAKQHAQAVYQASWALKDDPEGIPADYTADTYWP